MSYPSRAAYLSFDAAKPLDEIVNRWLGQVHRRLLG